VELEDKQLEGSALDRELRLADDRERKDEELPVVAEEVVDIELAHRGQLLDALQLILDNETLAVSRLGLPQRETAALEALQAAVAGRDPTMGTFVYAEDRRRLLEQSLAVLQQNLAVDARFAGLADRVTDLREQLSQLEEAQDDHEQRHEPIVRVTPVDEPAEDESLTDFLASALIALAEMPHQSTLDGPEPSPVAKPVSMFEGPELPEQPRPASTLDGPEVVVKKPASTLDGPERPAEPRPASTLDGPERPLPVKPRSSLVPDTSIIPAVMQQPRKSSPSIPVPQPPKRDKP